MLDAVNPSGPETAGRKCQAVRLSDHEGCSVQRQVATPVPDDAPTPATPRSNQPPAGRLKAARKNFTLSMPGECVQGTTDLAKCTIKQTRKISGAEFIENTVVTIRVAPAAGKK